MIVFRNLAIIIFTVIVSGCGFKVSYQENSYNISEIISEGDGRINFKIKNKILINSKNNEENKFILTIKSSKNKNIKEKNISNEITKYELIIKTTVLFKSIDENKKGEFTVSKKGNFDVSKKYSDTLNNEKKLMNLLINDILEEIETYLAESLNDS